MKWFALILITCQSTLAAWCCCDLKPEESSRLSQLAEQLRDHFSQQQDSLDTESRTQPEMVAAHSCCSADARPAKSHATTMDTRAQDEPLLANTAQTIQLSQRCACPARLGQGTQGPLPIIAERGVTDAPTPLPYISFLSNLTEENLHHRDWSRLFPVFESPVRPPDCAVLSRFLI